MLFDLFDLISLVYAGLALRALWQLAHKWRALLDDTYTQRDSRLAWNLGFYLLTPCGVLAHELAHLAVAHVLGARDISLNFRLYWGSVFYCRRSARRVSSPSQRLDQRPASLSDWERSCSPCGCGASGVTPWGASPSPRWDSYWCSTRP